MRPGMGWGPGERVFLPHLIHRLASRLFLMVGNGRNTLDLSYARNVAHELRNPLGSLKNVHYFLRTKLGNREGGGASFEICIPLLR